MLNLLVQASLRNRVLTLIAAVVLCAYGWIAARGLAIDVLPDINRPTVSILTEAPGLAPEEVETRVTVPIENAVNGAAGVQRVRSDSGMGLSVVQVEYAWGTDVYRARQVVAERLLEIRDRMPEGVTPVMGPVSSLMGEIMLIGVYSEPGPDGAPRVPPMAQRDAAEWTVRPALMSVPGVAQVTVMGGEVRQFQVKADPDRLRLYELTLEDLEKAVRASNASTGGGFLVGQSTELAVRNVGRVRSVRDVEEALVASRVSPEGHAVAVRVKDVARVVEGPAPAKRGDASVMGRPGVLLAVTKQPGSDTRALTAALDERLDRLRGALPPGLVLDADIFRQSAFIGGAVSNVIEALRDGAILVVVVLVLFLMNARVTVITLTAIPLSMLSAFIFFKLAGQSVNTMTLGGIAIAVGELVDDAVVGVENIFRRLRENRAAGSPAHPMRVVFDATSEVRGPILVSTAIVLLVFLPLFFLPGLAGRLFTPLAQAYIVSIGASMLVSLTVTPVLSWYLLARPGAGGRAGPERHGDGPVLRACKRVALGAYDLTMGRAWTVVGVCLALVVLAGVGVTRLGTEFLPPFNEGTAVVSVTSAPGTSLPEMDRIGRAAEALVLEIPEVKRVARRVGRAERDEHALSINASELEIDFFKEGDDRAADRARPAGRPGDRTPPPSPRARREVFADIRERLSHLPGVSVSVGQPIGHRIEHLESGVQAQVAVKVFGPELGGLRAAAARVRGVLEAVAGTTDVSVERQVLAPQVRVRIDPERAARYGFTVSQLADTLETAVGGKVVSEVLDGARSYDLVVMLDDPWRADVVGGAASGALSRLGEVRLVSPSGAIALVADVCEILEHLAPNQVVREGGSRRIVVSCNVQGRDLGSAVEEIERGLRGVRLPEGCTLSLEGQHESQRRSTRVIAGLGALSLAIMLALLWGHFGNLVMALQVMLNIPFAFIGAVATLLIFREPFSVASLVGFISLCGIAARNGVLMVSHYIHLMTEEGRPFSRETVVRGSQERVAPVLMTALTTGLAMLPLLLHRDAPGKEVLYPVALVVLGGLVTSTLLDFFVTPAVFLRFSAGAARRVVERWRAGGGGDDAALMVAPSPAAAGAGGGTSEGRR